MCIVALVLTLCMIIPANIITADAKSTFYSKASIALIKKNIEKDAKLTDSATTQGACTDGKYAYFAVNNNGKTTILKYNASTWNLKKKSATLSIGHANDMTYNKDTDKIIVANHAPDYKTLTFLDPDTLKITGTKKIKYKIYSIAYNDKKNQYVVGLAGTYNFAILNSKFKLVKKVKGYNSGYLRQGIDCDNKYIYCAQSSTKDNLIVVYNWAGKKVDTITVDKNMEIENIFHINNAFFITLHYYGNYVYRIGINKDTAIKFKVKFDPNGADGEMKSINVKYGKEKKLPQCTFEKEGYIFGGWIMKRDGYKKYYGKKTPYDESTWLKESEVYEYTPYKDKANISKTTALGNITATAFWISENYYIYYDPGDGDGFMYSEIVGYNDIHTLDKCTMSKQGYTFAGWTAKREYDNKIFGYAKKQKEPKWLKEKDVAKAYIFNDEEKVSKLTYDYSVTFTATWQSAFEFSKDEKALIKYSGNDTDVVFPETAGKVSTIKKEAFADNTAIHSVLIPSTITTLEENVFKGCSELDTIYFDSSLPVDTDKTSFVSEKAKKCYLKLNDKYILLGFCTGGFMYDNILNIYSKL